MAGKLAVVTGGKAYVVSGFQNKLQAALAPVVPDRVLAKQHRGLAEPEQG